MDVCSTSGEKGWGERAIRYWDERAKRGEHKVQKASSNVDHRQNVKPPKWI